MTTESALALNALGTGLRQGAIGSAVEPQDSWKNTRSAASEIFKFAGAHWQTCVEGGGAGETIGSTVGLVAGPEGALFGGGAGAIVGSGDLVQAEILLEIDSQ